MLRTLLQSVLVSFHLIPVKTDIAIRREWQSWQMLTAKGYPMTTANDILRLARPNDYDDATRRSRWRDLFWHYLTKGIWWSCIVLGSGQRAKNIEHWNAKTHDTWLNIYMCASLNDSLHKQLSAKLQLYSKIKNLHNRFCSQSLPTKLKC